MIATMKLSEVGSDDATVEKYINDPEWVMQQKFDGTHALLFFDTATHEITWGNGSHSAAKQHHAALEDILLPALAELSDQKEFIHAEHIMLDGELLIRTGEYLVWDLLVHNPHSPEGEPYGVFAGRHAQLKDFYVDYLWDNPLVRFTPTAWNSADKREMWERVKASNVEGAVSKKIDSLYVPGTRSKDWIKHKFVKTADLVVTHTKRVFKDNGVVSHGSANLAYVSSDGQLRGACSTSLIGKDLTIEEGDVVEVRYLYRETGGGGLIQPAILRKRWDAKTNDGDKRPGECTEDQFPSYSREVVFF